MDAKREVADPPREGMCWFCGRTGVRLYEQRAAQYHFWICGGCKSIFERIPRDVVQRLRRQDNED